MCVRQQLSDVHYRLGVMKNVFEKEKLVIFGMGEPWKKYYKYVLATYEVETILDNNPSVVGTREKGILVSSPNKVTNYSGKIVIATLYKSYPAIVQQLEQLGVDDRRIFFLQYSFYDERIMLVPCKYGYLRYRKRTLEQYDQVRRQPLNESKRILFLCSFHTVYLIRLIANIKERFPSYSISVLTETRDYLSYLKEYVDHIYVYGTFFELNDILYQIENYDVFQTLWIEHVWCYFKTIIRSKCERLNLCIGGSDLYRSDEYGFQYKKDLIDLADIISGETEETIATFLNKYPEATDKMRCVVHGVSVIDYIDKVSASKQELCSKFNIPSDKIIITCGHNANKAHQHVAMINSIKQLSEEVKNQAFFVFPMTYNSVDVKYVEQIKNMLNEAEVGFRVMTDFMDENEMAEYAKVSDIMIHVQTTDQLSSTMLEEMYAGAVIIAGSWLPYESLSNRGIFFLTVNNIQEISKIISNIIDNMDFYKTHCINNRAIIREYISWDSVVGTWIEAWGGNEKLSTL